MMLEVEDFKKLIFLLIKMDIVGYRIFMVMMRIICNKEKLNKQINIYINYNHNHFKQNENSRSDRIIKNRT